MNSAEALYGNLGIGTLCLPWDRLPKSVADVPDEDKGAVEPLFPPGLPAAARPYTKQTSPGYRARADALGMSGYGANRGRCLPGNAYFAVLDEDALLRLGNALSAEVVGGRSLTCIVGPNGLNACGEFVERLDLSEIVPGLVVVVVILGACRHIQGSLGSGYFRKYVRTAKGRIDGLAYHGGQ